MAVNASAAFEELSAVNAGRQEVRDVIERAAHRRATSGEATILFLDEIHRFNKAQQDTLLPAVEEGLRDAGRRDHREPVLRGELGAALALPRVRAAAARATSRCCELLRRALTDERGIADPPPVDDDALEFLAARSGGDARTALAALELAARDRGRGPGDAAPSPRTRSSAGRSSTTRAATATTTRSRRGSRPRAARTPTPRCSTWP